MAINNAINSPTNSAGWTSYTVTITGSTSNPTKASGATETAYYLQQGKILYIMYRYISASAAGAAAGSGDYLFSLPTGFTINTAIAPTFGSGGVATSFCSIGNAAAKIGATRTSITAVGSAICYDSTHFGMDVLDGGGPDTVSSTNYELTNSNLLIAANLVIPIL